MVSTEKIAIDSLSEAVLYKSEGVTVKTGDDIVIGKGLIIVTSRSVNFRLIDDVSEPVEIDLRYEDILFHAINKVKGFVLLNADVDNKRIANSKLLVYGNEVKEIFEQISIGSSMNPDEQQENDAMNRIDVIKYAEEEEEEEEGEENDIEMDNGQYKSYDYSNSIDLIFDTHKIVRKKDKVPENDPRRFEDAD